MIIVQIITGIGYGGAEKLVENYTRLLVDKHELHVIYLKGEPRLKEKFHPSVRIHHIPLNVFTAGNIRKFIIKIKPDIVHTHLGHADIIGLWACRGLKLRMFCTMHNIWFKYNFLDYIFFTFYFLLFKTVARDCHVTCISKAVARHVRKLGAKKKNIHVIYNAIPSIQVKEHLFVLRKELNIPMDQFIFLFIGRLSKQKSVTTLLNAIALIKEEIKNAKFLIVGEGELRGELEKLSVILGIKKMVEFIGVTYTPEKYFAACDVFILPSIFEGLPTVVLEAFRASLPVITSDIEGPRELIVHGENGLMFKSGDAAMLASLIKKMFHDEKLRENIGKSGYNSFINRYDIKLYVQQLEKLYLEEHKLKDK